MRVSHDINYILVAKISVEVLIFATLLTVYLTVASTLLNKDNFVPIY